MAREAEIVGDFNKACEESSRDLEFMDVCASFWSEISKIEMEYATKLRLSSATGFQQVLNDLPVVIDHHVQHVKLYEKISSKIRKEMAKLKDEREQMINTGHGYYQHVKNSEDLLKECKNQYEASCIENKDEENSENISPSINFSGFDAAKDRLQLKRKSCEDFKLEYETQITQTVGIKKLHIIHSIPYTTKKLEGLKRRRMDFMVKVYEEEKAPVRFYEDRIISTESLSAPVGHSCNKSQYDSKPLFEDSPSSSLAGTDQQVHRERQPQLEIEASYVTDINPKQLEILWSIILAFEYIREGEKTVLKVIGVDSEFSSLNDFDAFMSGKNKNDKIKIVRSEYKMKYAKFQKKVQKEGTDYGVFLNCLREISYYRNLWAHPNISGKTGVLGPIDFKHSDCWDAKFVSNFQRVNSVYHALKESNFSF